jgi:uncharacterized protein (DUF1778 family)
LPRDPPRPIEKSQQSSGHGLKPKLAGDNSKNLALCGSLPYNILAEDRMTEPATRTARLEARITTELQALLKRAAGLEGRSLSDFVVSAAREAAERRIEQAQVIRLSAQDQRAFVEAILDPPEPTPALRRAFRRHRELIERRR